MPPLAVENSVAVTVAIVLTQPGSSTPRSWTGCAWPGPAGHVQALRHGPLPGRHSLRHADKVEPDLCHRVRVAPCQSPKSIQPLSEQPLYQTLEVAMRPGGREVELTFIPYYAWANREPAAMQVWIPYVKQ